MSILNGLLILFAAFLIFGGLWLVNVLVLAIPVVFLLRSLGREELAVTIINCASAALAVLEILVYNKVSTRRAAQREDNSNGN